jgi:hypothetical protein
MRPFLPPVPPLALQALLGVLANRVSPKRVSPSRLLANQQLVNRVVPS